MTTPLTYAGSPVLVAGQSPTVSSWADIAVWDHSWDLLDAEIYIPDAAEQAAFGIDASPRVHSVMDRFNNTVDGPMPLLRDTSNYGTTYGEPRQLPGPLYLPDSPRFRRRPCMYSDVLPVTVSGNTPVMSAQKEIYVESQYYNAPVGYPTPYWFAFAWRGTPGPSSEGGGGAVCDSLLGSSDATITLTAGPQLGSIPGFAVAAWSDFIPGPTIHSTYIADPKDSCVIFCKVSDAPGNSELQIIWKDERGIVLHNENLGSLNPNPLREFFVGWHHRAYWSAIGIKQGHPTFGERLTLIAFAAEWLTSSGQLPERV